MLRPSMIVADEPVSALDVSIQAQILNLMLDLQREHGLTYLFISHDLSVVRYMADVIGVMYLGKLVEVGPADSVYSSPVHPYTRGLIDTVPVADPVLERAKENQGVRGELPSAVAPPSGCRFRTRCPRAQDLCAAEEPPLRPFTADGHLGACHFPLSSRTRAFRRGALRASCCYHGTSGLVVCLARAGGWGTYAFLRPLRAGAGQRRAGGFHGREGPPSSATVEGGTNLL